MKVLMFGWEFPPYASGGLGTACFGLTKGLCNHGIDITFVIPHAADSKADFVKLVSAGNIKNIKFKEIDSPLQAYMTSTEYKETLRDYIKYGKSDEKTNIYGRNLFEEVARYAASAGLIAKHEPHDIIHCHDWMTYQAGINARKISKKPLVVHVHATEFDRTGDHPNQVVYDMEYKGFHEADHIMAVSQFTKNKIVKHYNINPDKITVVHNAVEFNDNSFSEEEFKIKEHNKIVLFLGRITLQKGPEYFLYAAKKVLDIMPDVRFVMAGSGDMDGFIINEAARIGIGSKVLFTGFLRGKDIDRAYQMADLYVMPSVSEPFGITPLEAMRNGTPVLISKQSGVSEVVNHCFKVDFWDIDEMANKIISTLRYNALSSTMKYHATQEVNNFSWDTPAKKCIEVYNNLSYV